MIISCPTCGAGFNVKPEALGSAGRTVKCSKCAHQWHAMPDAEPADDALDGAGAPTPEDTAPEPTPTEPAAATEAAIGEPAAEAAADVADEAAVDDAPAEDAPAPAAETNPQNLSEDVPQPDDSVEKILSNAAMDNLFGSDDEADADGDAAAADGDGNAEDTATAGTEDIPTAWTADDDADQGAGDDAQTDGFPPPPGAAGDSDADEAAVAAEGDKGRSGLMRLISLLALILLISAVVGVGYFMQSKVVMWFPATSKIYAMVGLKPDVLGQGLHIADPKPTKEIDGNDEVLVVSGAIKNTSGNKQKVPLLRGALLDKDGKELHIWTFTAQQGSVEPGEQVIYKTQFKNPPAAAEKLDITFTRPSDDPQTAGREAAMPNKK